jgi:hypothetical protein
MKSVSSGFRFLRQLPPTGSLASIRTKAWYSSDSGTNAKSEEQAKSEEPQPTRNVWEAYEPGRTRLRLTSKAAVSPTHPRDVYGEGSVKKSAILAPLGGILAGVGVGGLGYLHLLEYLSWDALFVSMAVTGASVMAAAYKKGDESSHLEKSEQKFEFKLLNDCECPTHSCLNAQALVAFRLLSMIEIIVSFMSFLVLTVRCNCLFTVVFRYHKEAQNLDEVLAPRLAYPAQMALQLKGAQQQEVIQNFSARQKRATELTEVRKIQVICGCKTVWSPNRKFALII